MPWKLRAEAAGCYLPVVRILVLFFVTDVLQQLLLSPVLLIVDGVLLALVALLWLPWLSLDFLLN